MSSDRFMRAAGAPLEELAARSRASGKPLGVALTTYFPLEVLDAFGLEGALVPPLPREGFASADSVLQAFTCACTRSIADQILVGGLPIGLIAGTSGCDAQTALTGVLAGAGVTVPIVALRMPIQVGTPTATRHVVTALAELVERTEAALGRPLDAAALDAACTARQQVREHVTGLFAGLADGRVAASTAYAAAMASWVMAPRDFLDAVGEPAPAPVADQRVRLLVSGSVLPAPQIIADIEAMGGAIVLDDTETGARGASRRVTRDGGTLLDAIARSLVDGTEHGPVRHTPGVRRVEHVAAAARAARVQAALLVNYKYCDPHAFEAPALMAALKDAGIPSTVIEVDREPGLPPRERTRVQTLVEAVA